MKKLVISKKFFNLLEENDLDPKYFHDAEIFYGDWRGLDISKFRFLLHKIIELSNFEDKEILNKEISANNFTSLIMLDVLNVEED